MVNTTVFFDGVVEKLLPAMMSTGAFLAMLVVLMLTTGAGTTLATWTAGSVVPLAVTVAVSTPTPVGPLFGGFGTNDTVSCVPPGFTAVTVPMAPRLLNTTVV